MDEKNTSCSACQDFLNKKPIIHVLEKGYEGYFCYSCAKKLITYLEDKNKKEAEDNYKKYLEKHNIAKQQRKEWNLKTSSYSNNILIDRFFIFVVPITATTFIMQDGRLSYTIWSFIISSIYFLVFLEVDLAEFLKDNPEPDTSYLLPKKWK